MNTAKPIYGQKFGKLTAIKPVGRTKHRSIIWLCKCDCGKNKEIPSASLRSGNSKSCGCARAKIKHGLAYEPEYKPWTAMKYRCDNPNNSVYYKYGGRGISVCPRWYDFALFMQDMGSKPSPKHSIERIDNEGDYTPDNCRWATPKEQAQNTRQNVNVTFNGETMCVTAWAERMGMCPKTLFHRIYNPKMSIEDAITKPVQKRRKPK